MRFQPERVNETLDVLSHHHRRGVLVALLEQSAAGDARSDVDSLSESLAAGTEMETERMQILLRHRHLPKLEAAGHVTWDRDERTVAKGPRWDELGPFLSLLDDLRPDVPIDGA